MLHRLFSPFMVFFVGFFLFICFFVFFLMNCRARGRKSLNTVTLGCDIRKVDFTVHSKDRWKMKHVKGPGIISQTYIGKDMGAVERLKLPRGEK